MGKVTVLLFSAAVSMVWAQPQGNQGETQIQLKGKTISIRYGRPLLRGRDMLARATPGMVWRLGMDHATSLETESDLVFGSATVPKGQYSLFAEYLKSRQWQLLVNSRVGIWGTNHDSQTDISRIPLEESSNENSVEQLTITLKPMGEDSAQLSVAWGSRVLKTHFTIQ